jgi:hypothetical protein
MIECSKKINDHNNLNIERVSHIFSFYVVIRTYQMNNRSVEVVMVAWSLHSLPLPLQ